VIPGGTNSAGASGAVERLGQSGAWRQKSERQEQ
jgi:hypothetical protein